MKLYEGDAELVDGDVLALQILMDTTLTEKQRQKLLSKVSKQFSAAVEKKLQGSR